MKKVEHNEGTCSRIRVDVVLVGSNQNLAYKMTCVPQRWYDMAQNEAAPVKQVFAASLESMSRSPKSTPKQ